MGQRAVPLLLALMVSLYLALAPAWPAWADPNIAGSLPPEVLVPYRYARVLRDPLPVYRHPTDAETDAPIRQLIPPNTWVSIEEEIAYEE